MTSDVPDSSRRRPGSSVFRCLSDDLGHAAEEADQAGQQASILQIATPGVSERMDCRLSVPPKADGFFLPRQTPADPTWPLKTRIFPS